MQEQPGGERRAGAVLDYDLPRSGDLEFAQQAGRRRPDHRLQSLEASRAGSIAGIGRDHRRRRGVHLNLLLDRRAPGQSTENDENLNSLVNHSSLKIVRSRPYDGRMNCVFKNDSQGHSPWDNQYKTLSSNETS